MADVKYELLLKCLMSDDNEIGCAEARDSILASALDIIREIKLVVRNGYNTDAQAMEEIVNILQKHGIDCGIRNKKQRIYVIE